jgi:hypothetical protein
MRALSENFSNEISKSLRLARPLACIGGARR